MVRNERFFLFQSCAMPQVRLKKNFLQIKLIENYFEYLYQLHIFHINEQAWPMKCEQISGMISIAFLLFSQCNEMHFHCNSFGTDFLISITTAPWRNWTRTRKLDQRIVLIDCWHSTNVWQIRKKVLAIWLNGIWRWNQNWSKFPHVSFHIQILCLAVAKSEYNRFLKKMSNSFEAHDLSIRNVIIWQSYGIGSIQSIWKNKQTFWFAFRSKTTAKADWQSEFRNNSMFMCIELKRWYVITPARSREETNNFIEALKRAGRGMQFNLGNPRV